MFCSRCGKEMNEEAVVCIHCGCDTLKIHTKDSGIEQPIIINNGSSSVYSSETDGTGGCVKRSYSLLFDIFMIGITGGVWIIWMLLRPKYYL